MENNFTGFRPNSEIRKQARESLKGNWGKAIFVGFIYFLIVLALCVIPVVGSIVSILVQGPLALGFILAYYNLSKNEDFSVSNLFDGFTDFKRAFLATLLVGLFTFLWSLLLVIPGIIAAFGYSQTYYVLLDNPDMTAVEAMKESKRIMKGNKWKLFCLHFSFIGWAILCSFTLGIGYLWLTPYISVSVANFYKSVKQPVTV